ncbi:delta5 fatty acid desaturase [Phlyctochytrium arcticum]|nr:delta5 fatty acid desaturase [Phlyctochytrium arcticum]
MCLRDPSSVAKGADAIVDQKELSQCNTRQKALLAVRGNIYDVTSFIDRHPGGKDILLMSAGRDVTQVFETYHDEKALATLNKFKIGRLADKGTLPTFPEPSAFQLTLRHRIAKYFKDTKQDPKYHIGHVLHYIAVAVLSVLSYYATFFVPFVRDNLVLSSITSVIFGVLCAESCFTIVHDGSHASFSHRPWVWVALGAWHDFVNGASQVSWFYQHVLGHHPYTNIPNADPDIHVSEAHFRRIRKDQKWFSKYLKQHFVAPLMYSLYGFKSRYDDINILYFTKQRGEIAINPMTNAQHAMFWGGKAFFVFHRLILPAFFMPITKVLWFFILSDLATAWTLALVFQANHVVEHVDWPEPDKVTNVVAQDWMELQITTAQDYSHNGFWTTKLTGGLNYQVVHHAFPQVCQWYYPEIAPIVKETCREYNVPYVIRKDFYEAIGDHINLLWKLGRADQDSSKKET